MMSPSNTIRMAGTRLGLTPRDIRMGQTPAAITHNIKLNESRPQT